MYKTLLFTIILAFLVGCGSPKPMSKPEWVTNPPKDEIALYVSGSGDSLEDARADAIESLKQLLNDKLDKSVNKDFIKNENLKNILLSDKKITQDIEFSNFKEVKNILFNKKYYLLLSVEKKILVDNISKNFDTQIVDLLKKYKQTKNQIAIKKFIFLKDIMTKEYPNCVAIIKLKSIVYKNYNIKKELSSLNKIKREFELLKNKISFYILTDKKSHKFLNIIENSVKEEGLSISKKAKTKDAIKVLVTLNKKLKIFTYNMKKERISFVEHDIDDVLKLKSKISEIGVFNFIGLKK